MQSVQITVKATHGYGTEKTFETIKKELCERYPLEGHIRWVDYDVPKAAKVVFGETVETSHRLLRLLLI